MPTNCKYHSYVYGLCSFETDDGTCTRTDKDCILKERGWILDLIDDYKIQEPEGFTEYLLFEIRDLLEKAFKEVGDDEF